MYRRAYVSGNFDCLHRGHLALLTAVREIAVETVVSLNTDEFAARYKRPTMVPLEDRQAVLEACRLVDQVVVNTGDEDSKIAIAVANVDCVIHGSDWQGEALMRQMGLTQKWLDDNGIDLVIVPYSPLTSTSAIIERFKSGGVETSGYTGQPATMPCTGCGRAIYVEHANAAGNCGCVTSTGHESNNTN